MSSNCTDFGQDPDMIYGLTARRLRSGLEVALCLPSIQSPIHFNVNADHAEGSSETHLGYQLEQSSARAVIYTNKEQMPNHIREQLELSCTLVHYADVQFRMSVGKKDVFLPTAEYENGEVREIDERINNQCEHEYDSPTAFLQSVLEYPSP